MRGWTLTIATAICLAGCGGGGGSGGGGSAPAPAPVAQNVLPIIVDAGTGNTINTPFVSVTICAPGGGICQTIDHVIVDTASTGLRIMSSALSPSLTLTQRTAGNGNPLVQCTQFASGYTWGSVKAADVRLGGEFVNSLAIQVIGDPGFTNVPGSCSSTGSALTLGGNGILGVGVFQQDCGTACSQAAIPGTYYACTGGTCQAVAVALAQQVQNPVGQLSSDNNGVVIELPTVAATGAANINGSLFLGISTQANNGLGNAVVFALNPGSGTLTTLFNGQSYAGSFIDSGSNAVFFPGGAITVCSSGFYCPASPQQFTATNQGTNGSSGAVDFTVANADSLLNTGNTAFSNIAAPSSGMPHFDWGLPFHFGRRVFTAIEARSSAGGNGPYVAY